MPTAAIAALAGWVVGQDEHQVALLVNGWIVAWGIGGTIGVFALMFMIHKPRRGR